MLHGRWQFASVIVGGIARSPIGRLQNMRHSESQFARARLFARTFGTSKNATRKWRHQLSHRSDVRIVWQIAARNANTTTTTGTDTECKIKHSQEHKSHMKCNLFFVCKLDEFAFIDRTRLLTKISFVLIQLQQTNPAFITGLYNQYILQQNNTQQQLNASNGNVAAFGDKIDESGDQKSDDLHSNQPSTSPIENNLMLQINADKQSSAASSANNEILQQLYNYSQMSGELIK